MDRTALLDPWPSPSGPDTDECLAPTKQGSAPQVGDQYEISFESEIPPYILGPEVPYSHMTAKR